MRRPGVVNGSPSMNDTASSRTATSAMCRPDRRRQPLDAAEEVAAQPRGLTAEVDPQVAGDHPLEKEPCFEPREVRAEARVRAPTEPEVIVGGSVADELIRALEGALVAIGRREPHDDLVARRDRFAVHLEVAGCGSPHRDDWRDPAH